MNRSYKKYLEAIRYLESMSNIKQPDYLTTTRGRSLFLRRFRYFLHLLGNPQRDGRYIHVGGTSGKGSVATMIQSILTEAGFKTGLYTSPYPTTFAEKIKINHQLISATALTELIEMIEPAIDAAYTHSPYGRPSWYEISTALALLYFKQQQCDYAVLEVGLGGRYDATNVIPTPVATVINKIGFDHVELLGKTLEKIAQEKAGIIKPKTQFFTPSTNPPAVLKIFERVCRRQGVALQLVKPPKTTYRLKLIGRHQQHNAAIAQAVCQRLGVPEPIIRRGLGRVRLACRLEIIQRKPFVIIDGAHNESKLETTVSALRDLTYRKLYLIIALTHERDPLRVFKKIIPLADHLYVTRYFSTMRACYSPLALAAKLKKAKKKKIFLDPRRALNEALRLAGPSDLILITGSLFLAGELRKHWRSEERIVADRRS